MAQSILQSGTVTPGHMAKFVTDGVLADAGVISPQSNVLATLLSADFNSILDQTLQLPNTITAFQITGIIVTNPSTSLTTAVGGFYPTTAKGGTAIVAASQVYSSLTLATKLLACTLSSGGSTTRYSSSNVDVIDGYPTIYFSLSTAQGIASTGDIYVLGNNLSI